MRLLHTTTCCPSCHQAWLPGCVQTGLPSNASAVCLTCPVLCANAACLQVEGSDDEPSDSEAAAHDYLLPFLPPGMALAGGAGSLTREQALAVRERCLRALKDRLTEHANIIQVQPANIAVTVAWFSTRLNTP